MLSPASSGPPRPRALRDRLARFVRSPLAWAMALFMVLGWWATGRLPAGHEEISALPHRSVPQLTDTGERVPACGAEGAGRLVKSGARPTLALCAGDVALPLLIAPYASGVPHWHAYVSWPVHQGNPFALRRWNLLLGLIALYMAHRLTRKLIDQDTADASVLLLSVSPPFVLLYSLLLSYESAPWLLATGGVLTLLPAKERVSPLRAGAAGLLFGLGFMSNIKLLFTLIALGFVALRYAPWQRIPKASRVSLLLGAALGAAPLFALNQLHGGAGLEEQSRWRSELLARKITLTDIESVLTNLVRFGADTGSYGVERWEPLGVLGWLAALVCAASLVYVAHHGLRCFIGLRANPLLAFSGLLALGFLFVSLKLYDQSPGANYASLHVTYSVGLAGALAALARRLTRGSVTPSSDVQGSGDARRTAEDAQRTAEDALRTAGDARRRRVLFGLAALAAVPLGTVSISRLKSSAEHFTSHSTVAEIELADYLTNNPGPPLYTTTYNLAGVIDALSRGEVRTTRADTAVHCEVAQAGSTGAQACQVTRFRALLDRPGALPARFILPANPSYTDEPSAPSLEASLKRAAALSGRRLTTEVEARASNGVPALRAIRVDAAP